MKRSSRTLLLAFAACFSLASCLKKDYDTPPDTSGYDPNLPTNMTIDSLKKLKLDPDTAVITEDWVLDAVVIADDRSGNLYKQIVVQDETGGIALGIDAYSLYANYPVGRKIYINLKGLVLGANSGTPTLGGGASETGEVLGIGANVLGSHVIKASVGNTVKDTVLTYEQARVYTASTENGLVNRLVTIVGVQFADTSRTYTEATATTNRYLTTCGDNTYVGLNPPSSAKLLAVRSSNYANFHGYKLPSGNGTIHGIFTVYNTTPQIILRDTSDVQFYNPRCSGTTPPPSSGTARLISIDSLRMLYGTSGAKLGAYKITGTVTSDASYKNISTGAFIIQDGSGKAVQLYLGGSASYALGDSILIDVTGDSLKRYNGALEVDGSATAVTKIASGKTVAPVVLTIAQLNAGFVGYEQALVKILNATVQGGGTYSGNKTLGDGTATITLRTATTATFASQSVPTAPMSFTGLAGFFNATKQLLLRNPATDVQ